MLELGLDNQGASPEAFGVPSQVLKLVTWDLFVCFYCLFIELQRYMKNCTVDPGDVDKLLILHQGVENDVDLSVLRNILDLAGKVPRST